MAGLDIDTFDSLLKQHYTKDRVENLVYTDHPLFAMVEKMEDFGGRNLPIPIITGNPQNRSADFLIAQAETSSTESEVFNLTRVRDYAFCTIANEAIYASKGDVNAFVDAKTTEIDGVINTLGRSIATKMYRDGWGVVGRVSVSSSLTSSVLTLSQPSDVVNFERHQLLQFASTAGASGLRAAGAFVEIVAVDRSVGTLTVSPALSSITGLTAQDFIFQRGDRQDSASPVRRCISGLEAWVPPTSPGSALFFGVDRSVDPTRLGGLRFDGTNMPIEEALVAAANLVGREGGKITHYFMTYAQFSSLVLSLGDKVQYVNLEKNPEVGFRGVKIVGAKGPITVVPDPDCQADCVWGLQLDTWKLYSLGPAVRVTATDGNMLLRQPNADGVEVRYAFYGNLGCSAPGRNVRVAVAPPSSL